MVAAQLHATARLSPGLPCGAQTLEHALTAARERNAGKQVVADTKAGETSGMILSLLAEKIYRREVDIRAAFLRFDMGDGKIGSEDLGYALDQLGVSSA